MEQPILYNFYGKQYNYNDLAREADQGLNSYLSTIKRGDKDYQSFLNAYNNIMSGIRDGSITFDNNRFYDSKGRYSNAEKKNRDYYGIMANYIYNKMGLSEEYKKPEDSNKINWDNNSLKTALNRQIFNRDSGNLQDFLDLDTQKDGVRSTANRITYLANAFQSLADNWDNTFQNYQESDKARYLPLLQDAAKALRDGSINEGDYLTLSRAVDGIDFRAMLDKGTPIQKSVSQNTSQNTLQTIPQTTQQATIQQQTPIKYKHASLADIPYSSQTMEMISRVMTKVPTNGLISILRNSFYNRNYRFANDSRVAKVFRGANINSKAGVLATLNALRSRGLLKNADPDNPNLYYIPGLKTKYGTGWVWNIQTNSIEELPITDIPYFHIASRKNGGILKADNGTSFNNIWAGNNQDIGYNTYLNKIFKNQQVIDWMKNTYNNDISKYAEAVKRNVNERSQYGINNYSNESKYSADEGVRTFNTGYQNNGNTLNYTLFGKSADDYNNKVGVAYNLINFNRPNRSLKTGDSWNQDATKAYIDNAKGLQTYSRVLSLTDSNLKSGQFGIWGDYWKNNGATGAYYYIKEGDTSGKGQWIPTNDVNIKGYTPFETVKRETTSEKTPVVTQQGSNIDMTNAEAKKKTKDYTETLQNIAPIITGGVRLADSLHTNNKIAEVMKESINPVLKNTYELVSPVTGDFGAMSLKNQQAGEVMRRADRTTTSDASLNNATMLDANRQATDLQTQGFLADNAEIQRTKAEALKRQEDNIARRTETANYNRAAINEAEREKAQIEAQRLNSNWQSRDNFAAGIEEDLKEQANYNKYTKRSDIEKAKNIKYQYDIQPFVQQQKYQQKQLEDYYNDKQSDLYVSYKAKLKDWQNEHGEEADYTGEYWYKDYIAKQRALRDEYQKASYEMSLQHQKDLESIYERLSKHEQIPTTSTTNTDWQKIVGYRPVNI